jgi:hypothetical protein
MRYFLLLLIVLFTTPPAKAEAKFRYTLHAHFDKDDPDVESQSAICEGNDECTFPLRYKDQRIIIKSVLSPDLKIALRFYKDNTLLWTGNGGRNVYEIDGISKKSESHKIPLALPNPAYLKDAGRDEAVMRYAGPDVATINIWVEAGK